VPTKLNLRIEIVGHKSRRTTAIRRAVTELIQREKLANSFGPMKKFLGDDLEMLYFRTLAPIAASEPVKAWVRALRRQMQSAIAEANRGKCDTSLHVEYVRDS
jgi:hypothetical protein